ncbi:MAG: hypothetical protein K2X48_01785 [Chitinophagaceae bacterium]|nr:hypothetical protein [Chitinophagaceae bacterium]
MTAAKTVLYFGFYLYATGLTLLVAPNLLLSTLQMPATEEVWIRVVGVLVTTIGFYYHQIGSKNITPMLPLTVVARAFVFLSFVVFVLLKFVSPMLIVFRVIDLIGAGWTWMAFKKN